MTKLTRVLHAASASRLATYLLALWTLIRHPQTPRAARWAALGVLAYAVSPVDLVPDFIPGLGQIDDRVLIPMGIALVVRLTPPAHWAMCLAEADRSTDRLPNLRWGALAVVLVWALLLALMLWGAFAWLATQ